MSESPSTPSIHGQLSTLLGREVKQLRKTNDRPPRVSVIDTICAITDKDGRHAAEALRDLSSKYPEVDGNIVHFKFKGRGQRETPVTGARGIIDPWSASIPCASISRNDKRAPRDFGGGANYAGENKLGRRAARKRI